MKIFKKVIGGATFFETPCMFWAVDDGSFW